MKRAALAYAAKGIAVFPCWPNTKEPMTGRGFLDASTDPNLIEWWWSRTPNANVAIRTGFASFLVIDLDTKNGVNGRATLLDLERDYGPTGVTLTAETPSGGEHRYYVMPDHEIRNSAGKVAGEEAPGFDVRAEGGYVLAPPSVINGRAYVWTHRAAPVALSLWWLEALTPPKRQPVTAPAWVPSDERERSRLHSWCVKAIQEEARKVAATMHGRRNDQLWASASALGGLVHLGAIDLSDVRTALSWACSQWSERDVRKDERCIENGIRFGVANPRHVRLEERSAA